MKGLYCWVGFEKKEVVFDRGDRENGKSSYKLAKLVNLAIEGITSYTTTPLRISTVALGRGGDRFPDSYMRDPLFRRHAAACIGNYRGIYRQDFQRNQKKTPLYNRKF